MGTTINEVFEGGKRLRRKNALKRLEDQLKKGTKPERGNESNQISLTVKDISRIEKEIEILKSRI